MQASGFEPKAYTVALADDPFDNGHAAMSYILEHKAPVTAVMAGSDDIAHGAKDALRQHGKDVPRDVSLIGFEQSSGAKAAHLTSVQVDLEEVGRQLARMALARVVGGGREQPPVNIVRRSSCRPIRHGDSMVLWSPKNADHSNSFYGVHQNFDWRWPAAPEILAEGLVGQPRIAGR